MNSPGIVLLGLGPGDPDLLTLAAWRKLKSISEIHLRTNQHPVVKGLPSKLKTNSFDHFYESSESFEVVYEKIVNHVLALGERESGVVYAVPGSPFICETTSIEIAKRAREKNIALEIIEGLSFLEPVCTQIGVDPFSHTVLVDALEVARLHTPSFPPSVDAIIAQIHSRMVASEVKLTLMSNYPDDHPVVLVHAAGTEKALVENLCLYEIDRSLNIGLLTTLYVPSLEKGKSFEEFQEIIAHLRAPDGCPWDREQTHQTLRPHLLEETYELLAALDSDDPDGMQEELGDLLLQIVLHAQIASESGEFSMADVLKSIYTKIIHRHPHVFSDLELTDTRGVLTNWEKLKAEERLVNGEGGTGSLDGIPQALPSLTQAHEYQDRAARFGFDWKDVNGVIDKLFEELQEVNEADNSQSYFNEIGDLLFAIVNLARWRKVDAESSLRVANVRFRKRFKYIEDAAQSKGQSLSDLTLDEMERFWQEAKGLE